MKLRHILCLMTAMGLLLPCSASMAGCPYTYMLGHGSGVHYLLNMCSQLVLWKVCTPARLLAAYGTAIGCFYLPSSYPVLGWSVILYFLLGMIFYQLPVERKMRLAGCILLSFFFPHLAAWHHTVMFIAGYLYRKVESKWRRTLY